MLDFAKIAIQFGKIDLRSLTNILIEFPDHENPLNGVSFKLVKLVMIIALLVFKLQLASHRMVAMLYCANMAAP